MNKRAIITGASRGIGRGVALALAREGYDIAFSYATREDEAEQVARMIDSGCDVNCFFHQANYEQPGAGKAFFDWAVARLGGLDLLVNNAGITRMEPIQDLTEATMDAMIALDFRNYILMMHYASRIMIEQGIGGSIINITSSRGERAYPGDGVYGAMKAGLNRAIQSFALDLCQYGIRVNNVAPGAVRVRTPEQLARENGSAMGAFWDALDQRVPLGRVGTPEDIGRAVAFLASDNAAYITGVTLRVDGGLILPGMPEWVSPELRPGYWRPELKGGNSHDCHS